MNGRFSMGVRTIAELDVKGFHGEPGLGFHKLAVRIEFRLYPQEEGKAVITDLAGDMWIRDASNRRHYLGRLRRWGEESPLVIGDNVYTKPVYLVIELDGKRIEAIERIRHGNKLPVELEVYGLAHSAVDEPQIVKDTLKHFIAQSDWIDILEKMGYRKTLLIEIPMPGDEVRPGFSEAAEHLRGAQEHLLYGRFREAVGACRDVLESLEKALGDAEEVNAAKFERLHEKDKGDRLRLVRRALKVLTHPARHADEAAASIEWRPADARAVITMAASVFRMVVEEEETST